MPDVAFVMGACLDPALLRTVASRRALDATATRPAGRAYLPDAYPRFVAAGDHTALVHAPKRGAVAAGALFQVGDGFRLLDAAHEELGCGTTRERRVVLTDDGGAREVEVYVSAGESAPSARPASGEVDAVKRGLLRFGHDISAVQAAAEGRIPTTEPASLFVYGTLRSGESRHDALLAHDPFEGGKGVVHGSVPGKLYDLGDYPALLPHTDRLSRVRGEVYTFADLDRLFGDLDSVEGFRGYGVAGSEYVRAIVRVDLDLRERIAWTYVYAASLAGRRTIVGGDWHNRAVLGSTHPTAPG